MGLIRCPAGRIHLGDSRRNGRSEGGSLRGSGLRRSGWTDEPSVGLPDRPPIARPHSLGRHSLRIPFPFAVLLWVLLLCALSPLPAEGQHTTSGSLTGLITELEGSPLDGVEITLTATGGGMERTLTASREGRFQIPRLPPGEYELIAERFGYIPVRVTGIAIRSGREARVEFPLRRGEPPVTDTDRYTFAQIGSHGVAGMPRTLSRSKLLATPFPDRTLTGLANGWSRAGNGLSTTGLPGALTGTTVDGIRHDAGAHPRLGPGFLHLGSISPLFLQELELTPQSLDASQWGLPGGGLRATTVRGGNSLEVEGSGALFGTPAGDWDPLGRPLDGQVAPEGALLVRGPITPDTLHFAFGVEARQALRAVTPLATSSADHGEAFLDALAPDGSSDSGSLARPQIQDWTLVSTFGRIDWNLSPNNTLTLRSNLGVARAGGGEDIGPASLRPPAGSETTEALLGAELYSVLGERMALQVRLAGESFSNDYSSGEASGIPGLDRRSWIHEGGVLAGQDPGVPGQYRSNSLQVAPILHLNTDAHAIQLGMDVALRSYSEDAWQGTGVVRGAPTASALAESRGVEGRRDGPARDVEVNSVSLGIFVQDRWTPHEALALTWGIRADGESLPFDDILPSQRWTEQTGLPRDRDDEASRGRVSPRVGLEWRPAPGWHTQASGGIYHTRVNPAVLAEVMADSGAVRMNRTLGSTSATSNGDALSFQGRELAILGPRFDAPRTQAVDASVARSLPSGTTVEVGVGHRRTDFLPRRRDLNRVPSSFAQDQFGRSLFGEPTQEAGVIGIRPGSDRRFVDFDVVSALESDGWSHWTGVSVGISHEGAGPLTLDASYTYSQTRDNLPGGEVGWPGLIHGRPGTEGGDPAWVEGTSDLDVPHRAVVLGEMELLDSPRLRIGFLYSFRSGVPFTPGIRDFLHGSSPVDPLSREPIVLPSELDDLGQLSSEWSCLARLRQGTHRRNVCRTDGIHDLNLRLGFDLVRGSSWNARLQVDGLNLLDQGTTHPDPALFIVDGSVPLPQATDGRLQLPVKLNEHFGKPLTRFSPGRSIRIGLGVRY